MMKKLIIAEKESVATELAKIVSTIKFENRNTYFENAEFVITWCVGHLIQLAMPEKYGVKSWSLDTLPFIPSSFKLEESKSTKAQFGTIKALMHRHNITMIINACDAGREGELIFRLVYDYVKCTKPYKRLWISSYEDHVIEEGMMNLIEGLEMERLFNAGLCRLYADYLVGINATRTMTSKYGTTLNVGRVQSPTLNLICMRDKTIANFIEEPIYNVQLTFDNFVANFHLEPGEKLTKESAEKVKHQCQDKDAFVVAVDVKGKKVKPESLFNLTQLQKKANQYFGYSAKRTLEIAQKLYSPPLKLLTYPRTDSSFLSVAQATDFKMLIGNLVESNKLILQGTFQLENTQIYQVIDDNEVTDHHAILITQAALGKDWTLLEHDEWNIMNLVAYQMLMAISPALYYETTRVGIQVGDYQFLGMGNVLINAGFRQLERISKSVLEIRQQNRVTTVLPSLVEGEILPVIESEIIETKTTVPKRYTEADLLALMEKGLGTSATRAEIIETLIKRNYVVRDKRKLIATEKAHQLMSVLPEELKTLELTLIWEENLNRIALGIDSSDDFMMEIKRFVGEFVEREKEKPRLVEFMGDGDEREVIGDCPRCSEKVIAHKNGLNFHCWNKNCKFVLWKNNGYFKAFGKTITQARARSLLEIGYVRVSKLKSKKGNVFDGTFVMIDDLASERTNFKLEY